MSEVENNVPNLDAMDKDDLMKWWMKHQHGRKVAEELFPEKPKGFVTATRQLANYAANKATAIRCRLEGNIQSALVYEDICDKIYNSLPDWARGW